MPQRSNEFQRLVLLLQKHLATREGWSVEESRMVPDRVTGKLREVDIVVEAQVNGVPLLIGFECQDKSRPSDLNWVQLQAKRHSRLTDKLVLVSKAPFSMSALEEARVSGVATVSFADAVNIDWSAYIDQFTQLLFATFDLTLKSHAVDLQFTGGQATPPNPDLPAVVVVDDKPPVPYLTALQSIVKQRHVARTIMDQWYALPPSERKGDFEVNFTMSPPPGEDWMLVQGAGPAWRMTQIRGTIAVQTASANLPMAPSQFLAWKIRECGRRSNKQKPPSC